jgi:hypothetical protein
MKRFWMIAAGACIAGSAVALWRQHVDAAFVTATIGVMAWFLSYRTRIKELAGNAASPNEKQEAKQSDEHS